MAIKTAKNLLANQNVYNQYYGDFRGVDFSNDHTQVNAQRFPYAVNMYKDYQSGQGVAIETIAGYRKRFVVQDGSEIYGIHTLFIKVDTENAIEKVLVHAGSKLYLWREYPYSVNVPTTSVVVVPVSTGVVEGINPVATYEIDLSGMRIASLVKVSTSFGEEIDALLYSYNSVTKVLTISTSLIREGDRIDITYYESEIIQADILRSDMNTQKSVSFVFNNKLYIIDGANYLVYDGTSIAKVRDVSYVPTTYINIIPAGENADAGVEYEQRNMLTPKFKHTFIADGTNRVFKMNENNLDSVDKVTLYGVVKTVNTDYTVNLAKGEITFVTTPPKPENVEQSAGVNYPEFYAGVEIEASKTYTTISGITDSTNNVAGIIEHCTIATIFDNRVFLSGNPEYPNHIFYSGRNPTGYIDASYFGVLNFQQDGVGIAPIRGMVVVADTLAVLKGDTQEDGATYFHTPRETGQDLQPKVYPYQQGLSGAGCLGAAINFLDDPVLFQD